MKKSYKIDVDCANCANKMEVAANNTEGVKSAVVNFMMLKMNVEFEDGVQPKEVMARVGDAKLVYRETYSIGADKKGNLVDKRYYKKV